MLCNTLVVATQSLRLRLLLIKPYLLLWKFQLLLELILVDEELSLELKLPESELSPDSEVRTSLEGLLVSLLSVEDSLDDSELLLLLKSPDRTGEPALIVIIASFPPMSPLLFVPEDGPPLLPDRLKILGVK